MMWLKKPLPAALLLVILWTGFRLVELKHSGIPKAQVTDEFSYLLGADTFAHGRLVNPPHPLAAFFESPHILVRPVYASKYPPGHALFLALGQRLFGSPFYGVLMGNALMLFCFCLMLYTFAPYPWALVVSALVALLFSPGTFWLNANWDGMYWTTSYWGGPALVASGAALVLLGIGIFRNGRSPLGGIVFALGSLLLFWTRPYEGGVFTMAVLAVFAADLWRNRRASVVLAALAVFLIGGIWTGYYNWRITGSPLQLPYMMHDHQYNVTPVLSFLPLRHEPNYSTPRLAALHGAHGWEAKQYHAEKSRAQVLVAGFKATLQFMLGPLRTAALISMLFPIAWRDPTYRKMAIVSGVMVVALGIETFHFRHYAAPVWASLAVMIAIWASLAWKLRIGKLPIGAAIVTLTLLITVWQTPSVWVRDVFRRSHTASDADQASAPGKGPQVRELRDRRAELMTQLASLDRPQLVIVRYPSQDWRVVEEWVYNSSDIDHQHTILAHDLGADKDRELLNYYPDRTVSLLTFDANSAEAHLQPYPSAQGDSGKPAQ